MEIATTKHYIISDTTYSITNTGKCFVISIPNDGVIGIKFSMKEALTYIGVK